MEPNNCDLEESSTNSGGDCNVNKLIQELCCSMAKEDILEEKNIRKLTTKCFEVLETVSLPNTEIIDNNFDPIRKLDALAFASRQLLKNNSQELQKVKVIEKSLASINKVDYFVNGAGKDVIKFLLLLENKYEYPTIQKSLLVPAPFKLHDDSKNSKCYPNEALHYIWKQRPRFFKGIEEFAYANNPYIPNLLTRENERSAEIDSHSATSLLEVTHSMQCKFTHITHLACGLQSKNFQFWKYEKAEVSSTLIVTDKTCKSNTSTEQMQDVHTRNSENPDFTNVKRENIVSEYGRIKLSLQQFLYNVKLLTIGKQSDIFKCNEWHEFEMDENIVTKGLLPSTIHNYTVPFLQCGTAYRRLKFIYLAENENHGILFKAFTVALDEYLMTFRYIVFSIEDKYLLDFQFRMRIFIKHIVRFTNAVMKSIKCKENPPTKLLSFFCNELQHCGDISYIAILMFFLKRLCNVYFKQLEKWIYSGILDNNFSDLFICCLKHFKLHTKYYYDEVYYVNHNNVPGFLKKYGDRILCCGKYSKLLRTFKPTHPLFNIKYPTINANLSYRKIQSLRINCQIYYDKVLEVCGKPITVKKIFQQSVDKKRKLQQIFNCRYRENIVNRLEKKILLSPQAVKEYSQNTESNTQGIKTVHGCNIVDELMNIAEDLQTVTEPERIENKHLTNEKILQKNVALCEERSVKGILHNADKLNSVFKNQKVLNEITGHVISNETVQDVLTNRDELGKNRLEDKSQILIQYSVKNESPNDKTSEIVKNDNNILNEVSISKVNENSNTSLIYIVLPILKQILFKVMYKMKKKNSSKNQKDVTASFNGKSVTGSASNINIEFEKRDDSTTQNQELSDVKIVTDNHLNLECNRNSCFKYNKTRSSDNKIVDDLQHKHLDEDRLELHVLSETQCTNEKQAAASSVSATIVIPTASQITIKSEEQSNIVLDNQLQHKMSIELAQALSSNVNEGPSTSSKPIRYSAECLSEDCSDVEVNSNTYEPDISHLLKYDYKGSSKYCIEFLASSLRSTTLELSDSSEKPTEKKATNGLDVIAVTEFLQQSVTLPLNAYYQVVSNELMRLFLVELQLIDHIKSLRHYFLLMDSEFCSNVTHDLFIKLEKCMRPEYLFNFRTLHTVLNKALASSAHGLCENSKNLSFLVTDMPEKLDLLSSNVFHNLTLSYEVTWPLNYIIYPEILEKYGRIFTFLLKVKRINWLFMHTSRMLKVSSDKGAEALASSPQFQHVQIIVDKFFNFTRTLQKYVNTTVLQEPSKIFKKELLRCNRIEDIYRAHTAFIDRILGHAMIEGDNSDFQARIEHIFAILLRFHYNIRTKHFRLFSGEDHFTNTCYQELVADELEVEKSLQSTINLCKKILSQNYQKEIDEFIKFFNIKLKKMIA